MKESKTQSAQRKARSIPPHSSADELSKRIADDILTVSASGRPVRCSRAVMMKGKYPDGERDMGGRNAESIASVIREHLIAAGYPPNGKDDAMTAESKDTKSTTDPEEVHPFVRLRKDIEAAINSNSAENGSDTPDFILAKYLVQCLEAFDSATRAREAWYGRKSKECEPPIDDSTNKTDVSLWDAQTTKSRLNR